MNENIAKMPLKELLTYSEALENLCKYYEKQLIPLYGGPTTYGKDNSNQMYLQNKLNKAKSYLSSVLGVIESKVYDGLDNYKPVEVAERKIIKKESVTPRKPRATKTTKKKTDVKKDNQ